MKHSVFVLWIHCYHTQWTVASSVCGFFVYEISPEPLNGFAPNSHGRRVWSLARMSLKVKVKGQGHQWQKRHFFGPAAYVRFMFGKTSLASIFSVSALHIIACSSPLLWPPYVIGGGAIIFLPCSFFLLLLLLLCFFPRLISAATD